MSNFLEIINKYWSQIIVLLLGFGYLIKLYFNWRLKQKEITFDKIRETKLKELKQFYKSYINLESHLKELQFAAAKNQTENEHQIRKLLPDIWRQFYLDFTFLRIFLSTEELKSFENLHKELENIQLKLDYYQIDRKLDDYDTELIKELRYIRDNIFPKRIPELLRLIENNLKKDFNIK